MVGRTTLWVALAMIASPLAANAQDTDTRTGPYLGVQPGVKDSAPGKEKVRYRGANRYITWVGFQMQGRGSRVFIQTTEPAVYNIVPAAADEVVLEFSNTRLQTSNEGRALDTMMFPSAVGKVVAEQTRRDLSRVIIKLRSIVGYDLRQEGNYIFLDFRPPPAAAPAPAAPAPE